MTTLLITSPPHSKKAKDALALAQELCRDGVSFRVFFYGDGAYHANRLLWQSSDVPCVSTAWATLAKTQNLDLPVCVSTALARGITDSDNARRHNLDGDNVRLPFRLVGLSEFALMLDDSTTLLQF